MESAVAEEYETEGVSVSLLVEWFEDSQEATDNARKASERNRDYYDGKQLTSDERKKLRQRGQPDVIINRIQPKIDYLLGYEAATRTDPRAFPRNPQDEDASEAATDAIRYMADKLELDQIYSLVWEHMLIEGFGGVELTYSPEDNEIGAVGWDWDRLFYDPHSRKHDFSDARYLGGIIWMDLEDAKEKWGKDDKANEALEATTSSETFERTYDDRPAWKAWVSGQSRKRIRVVQIYYRQGHVWKWCIFTKGGKLDGGDVPFVDKNGMSFCPLILQSSYTDRDNNRYGLVNIMIGPQDEVNKRRSKALHLLTMRQTLGENGSVDDVEAAKAELAKPDGHVVVNPGFRFELLNTTDMASGHLQLLQESKAEIDLIGPNSAMLGKDDNAPSGRAILANQQGGQTELMRLMDRHRHLKRRTYERVWDMIRQYKNEKWWIRVTDNENNVKFVGLNRPVTMAEEMMQRLIQQGADEQQAQQQVDMLRQDPMRAAELEQVVRIENQPTEMDMDITLDEVVNTANVQEEQFQSLTNLAQAGVVFPPEIYIRASSLRNKEELLEAMTAQNQPAPDPMAEANLKKTMADIGEVEARTQKIKAELPKTVADTMKTMVEAENAGQEPMQPAGVPFDQQTGLPAA